MPACLDSRAVLRKEFGSIARSALSVGPRTRRLKQRAVRLQSMSSRCGRHREKLCAGSPVPRQQLLKHIYLSPCMSSRTLSLPLPLPLSAVVVICIRIRPAQPCTPSCELTFRTGGHLRSEVDSKVPSCAQADDKHDQMTQRGT